MWPFNRKKVEKRSAMSGFTAELIAARESYISGRRGVAELTGTAQSCISLWENGFAIADVQGTRFLNRHIMAMLARSLALRGEFVGLIREDGIVPAADWDLSTKDGRPRRYRVSISEAGGGTQQIALAQEVLHVRIGIDVAAPWTGTAPLRRAAITAGMLNAIESALAEAYEHMPLGSTIVPFPESPETDLTKMGCDFSGRRGRVLLRESVNVAAGGGPTPQTDWKPQDVTPDLQRAMPTDILAMARDSIASVFGVLPALYGNTTGPLVREAQRHLAQWTLQPIAELLAEEATEKLGAVVQIDMMTPTQAFDVGASSRSFATLIQAMAQAKEAGLDAAIVAAMFAKFDWKE